MAMLTRASFIGMLAILAVLVGYPHVCLSQNYKESSFRRTSEAHITEQIKSVGRRSFGIYTGGPGGGLDCGINDAQMHCDTAGASADNPANFSLAADINALANLVAFSLLHPKSVSVGDEFLITASATLKNDSLRARRNDDDQAETLRKIALEAILQRNIRLVGELTVTSAATVDSPPRQEIALVEGYPSGWIWKLRGTVSGESVSILRIKMIVALGQEKIEVEIGRFETAIAFTESFFAATRRFIGELQPIYAFVAAVVVGAGGLFAWLGFRMPKSTPLSSTAKKAKSKKRP